jgi:hypothetical protein
MLALGIHLLIRPHCSPWRIGPSPPFPCTEPWPLRLDKEHRLSPEYTMPGQKGIDYGYAKFYHNLFVILEDGDEATPRTSAQGNGVSTLAAHRFLINHMPPNHVGPRETCKNDPSWPLSYPPLFLLSFRRPRQLGSQISIEVKT